MRLSLQNSTASDEERRFRARQHFRKRTGKEENDTLSFEETPLSLRILKKDDLELKDEQLSIPTQEEIIDEFEDIIEDKIEEELEEVAEENEQLLQMASSADFDMMI